MKPGETMENLVLITVDLADSTTDADVVAAAIGVPSDAIDVAFGVVLIDPFLHRCAVKVKYAAFSERSETEFLVAGPYADPIVETL